MSLSDIDFSKLPEPKSKKFFRSAINGVKGTVNFARKLHERKVALEKAQDFHEAQRRGALHFKSPEKYRKWLATVHIHGLSTGAHRSVFIGGRPHKVVHVK